MLTFDKKIINYFILCSLNRIFALDYGLLLSEGVEVLLRYRQLQ